MPIARYHPISDLDDPRIADYVNLREADLVKRRGVFIAEGAEVVRTMLQRSRYQPRSLFLSEARIDGLRSLIEAVPADVPIFYAVQGVMDRVIGFPIHRGCLAAGTRPAEVSWQAALDEVEAREGNRIILVLESLANHDNVGAVFRNAAAFGVGAVLLDPRCADPLYRKAIRVSMGSSLTVPFARLEPWPRALQDLAARGLTLVALTPHRGARDIAEVLGLPLPGRVALLLGTEGEGLSDEALGIVADRWRIRMVEGFDSINVGAASAIALWLLRSARS